MEFINYFDNVFTVYHIALLVGGTFAGIILGALPGLSPTMSVALLIPFTFHMKPESGLILLGAMYTATVAGGAISAILVNVPGAPANIATAMDGHKLAQNGKAKDALHYCFMSSFVGGVFGVTGGLHEEFGLDRCIDMPISEAGIAGTAAGAALAGKRPVAEIMFCDFMGLCLDQLMNQAAKFRYMFGGKATCPMVLRTTYGAGMNAASQHSQSLHPLVTAIPGLKVAMPSTPADAKGLLSTAIRDDDPVIFFEHKTLYTISGDVPDGEYLVPFGKARMVSEGDDCTLVATGRMISFCENAAQALADDGITCDIIDPRTTSPLDEDAILDSVEKTGRLVVVDERLQGVHLLQILQL